eukprot:14168-Heterococcus_DN1.PRE.1
MALSGNQPGNLELVDSRTVHASHSLRFAPSNVKFIHLSTQWQCISVRAAACDQTMRRSAHSFACLRARGYEFCDFSVSAAAIMLLAHTHNVQLVRALRLDDTKCASSGKRRYDHKQQGFGGQTKPIFHKKAKTTKKVTLRLECKECKAKKQL